MVKHVIGRFLAAAAVATALLAGPAAVAATAAPVSTPVSAAPISAAPVIVAKAPADMCSNPQLPEADKRAMGCYDDRISANSNYLPAQRWAQAASGLHLRTGDGFLEDLSTRLQREATFPMWMSMGNWMWSLSTNLTSWAVSLDLMKSVGLQVDQIAAKLGTAIADSAILGALIGIGIIVVLWRAARGRTNPWRYIARASIVLALLTVMFAGATASTVSGGEYRPGLMSPGWLATKTNSIVSSLASAPALALSNEMTTYTPDTDTGQTGILSCDAYTAELAAQYAQSAGGTNALANKLEASVPMLLSRMWEQTGLEVWKTAQFGSSNSYGDYMYCRLLEERAGQAEVVQMMLTSQAATRAGTPISGAANPNLNAAPWGTGGDVESRDRSLIAWGACRLGSNGSWTVAGDWSDITRSGGRGAVSADDCAKWWAEDYYTDAGPNGWIAGDTNNLEFSGKASDTRNDTRSAPEARDFLLSLHGGGSNAGGNTVMVIAYFASSLAVLLVFLVLAGAVLIAKVAAVVMALAIFLLLLKDLLPGQEGNSSAAKVAKAFIGIAFATFALSLLLALVAVVTGFLVQAATDWFGGSSIMAIVWTGAAPLVALLSIHLLFTKILKMPSPLTVRGAKAWGDRINSGAIGGSFTDAVSSRAQAAGRAATGFARQGARAAGSEMLRRTTGGRLGGAPVKRTGSGVGSAAAAGALGVAGGAAAAGALAARSGRLTPAEGGRSGRATGSAAAASAEGGAPRGRARAGEPTRVEGAKTSGEGPTPEELQAPADAQPATRAQRRAQAATDREQQLADNATRRGYGDKPHTRAIGDAREAFSARLQSVREQFAEKPVVSSLRTAGAVGGLALVTVATGGAGLAAVAGVTGLSQAHKARADRRRLIENHQERRQVEVAAKEAAERKATERKAAERGAPAEAAKAAPGGVQRAGVLRSGTRTAVERRTAPTRRAPSRAPGVASPGAKNSVRATPKVAGARTATPRPAAPAANRRPALPTGGQ
ncbi:hypothetical protein [Pseudactinotalea terrae]|uniref:hypothetical protein n=1 Tax=Pseudactinotalea terrae TaxID=1743262 RepID=UPI0012E16C81|nr:hypothetical protein [Pseudactinotalea terrae]